VTKKRLLITDLENPLREVRDALVEITQRLVQLRRNAAQLRAVDNIVSAPDVVASIAIPQMAIDELAESVSHACARLTEARAHIAVANRAMSDVLKLMPAHEPKGPVS